MPNFDGMTPAEQDAWHKGRTKGFFEGLRSAAFLALPIIALVFAVHSYSQANHTSDVTDQQSSLYNSPAVPQPGGNPFKHCNQQYKKHHRYSGICAAMQPVSEPKSEPECPCVQPTLAYDPSSPANPTPGGYNGGSPSQPGTTAPPSSIPEEPSDGPIHTGDPGSF